MSLQDRENVRVIAHTADVGIEAFGETPVQAVLAACRGMFALMADAEGLPIERRVSLDVAGGDWEELVFNLLNELIYLSEADGLVFQDVHLDSFDEDERGFRLRLTALAIRRDTARGHLLRELKAATYHGLKFEKVGSKYSIRVIFDL